MLKGVIIIKKRIFFWKKI